MACISAIGSGGAVRVVFVVDRDRGPVVAAFTRWSEAVARPAAGAPGSEVAAESGAPRAAADEEQPGGQFDDGRATAARGMSDLWARAAACPAVIAGLGPATGTVGRESWATGVVSGAAHPDVDVGARCEIHPAGDGLGEAAALVPGAGVGTEVSTGTTPRCERPPAGRRHRPRLHNPGERERRHVITSRSERATVEDLDVVDATSHPVVDTERDIALR